MNSEEEEEIENGSEEESSDEDSEDSDIYARKDDKIKLVGSLNDFQSAPTTKGLSLPLY